MLLVAAAFRFNPIVELFLKGFKKIILFQLYSFGETISIPFWTETWKPDSFCEKLEGNLSRGLHTLCLLGIN